MKIIKVILNNDTTFISDIISEITIPHILEEYNISYIKDRRKAREIMERHGTKQVPLIVFEDENIKECCAIWSEQNPNWKEEIIKKLEM
jgi:hypothetical protein